ncbi:MAG TPA: hypothetical protein VK119_05630 [Bacillota bacterium]|nr:hypothetical protein [Bacillota bacterium]
MNHVTINTDENIIEASQGFDGSGFAGGIVLVVLLFLVFLDPPTSRI